MPASWFRSAPPGVGATHAVGRQDQPQAVSIRAPGWGRPALRCQSMRLRMVSIRAPGWGRPLSWPVLSNQAEFRSAPPGGGDLDIISVYATREVSIRAPGWGRPVAAVVDREQDGVSIRAPGWGRLWAGRATARTACFDPRPRVGATPSTAPRPARIGGFDPRPRVGATMDQARLPARPRGFVPRPRVGATCSRFSPR